MAATPRFTGVQQTAKLQMSHLRQAMSAFKLYLRLIGTMLLRIASFGA